MAIKGVTIFEKEAEEYRKEKLEERKDKYVFELPEVYVADIKQAFKDGAEFGYNKANEWHYVKVEGTPKVEGHYLVCLRNKDKDIFDCWINYDKDIGWYSMKVRMKDIYAWKEIVLPELKEED